VSSGAKPGLRVKGLVVSRLVVASALTVLTARAAYCDVIL